MKTITIEIPDGKRAEWVNGVLTLTDDRPADVRERIKTFEDACQWCKDTGRDVHVAAYNVFAEQVKGNEMQVKDILAFLKLRIIVAALNDGWEPQFTEEETRWFPWYYLYTEEKLAMISDEWRKSHTILDIKGRAGSRENSDAGAFSGFVFAYALNASLHSSALSGARLAFRTEELAVYAGKQFIEIYAELLLI